MVRKSLILGMTWLAGLSIGSARAQVVISEFLASNNSSIVDEDGENSDWIELFNTSSNVVDIAGWHLTDRSTNLTAWTLPQTLIQPGGFVLVFASAKDRATAGSELHTDFQLNRDGEYLALVKPSLAIATEFAPAFPEVQQDEAYGFPMDSAETIVIEENDAVRWLVPPDNTLGLSWNTANFDDNGWTSGLSGVGYETSPADYQNLINSTIPTQTPSVYTRFNFTLVTVPSWNALTLRMKYDDGFIAYLNGSYINGDREPNSAPAYNSTASSSHNDSEAVSFVDFDATHVLGQLQPGNNSLAIHGLNVSTGSSDMLVRPQLVAKTSNLNGNPAGPFSVPSPGGINPTGIVTPITFSEDNRLFTNSLSVALSTTIAGAEIYYTTDDTSPTTGDILYTGPIPVTTRTILKASVFFPGGGNSEPETRRYIKVDANVLGFDSSLPLVVVDTFNGSIPGEGQRLGIFSLIEPDASTGRTSLGDPASITTTANLSIRGSSSGGFAKKQYKMELVDEALTEVGSDLLGMGKESDWILYAPGRYDRNMIANNFIYELARRMGQPGMNTRFIEVFLNDDNGTVSTTDYDGIYVLMESIKIDKNRVDTPRLQPTDTTEPRVSGGYITSVDRSDSNQYTFNRDPNNRMGDSNTMNVINPKNDVMPQAQKDFIRDYTVEAVNALFGPTPEDPVTGYRGFMDAQAMADYQMLNALAHNVDAFRLSGYYYKERNGLIKGGPQWDFDRTLESADGRDNDPLVVRGLTSNGTLYFEYGWWDGLYSSEEFRMLHQDSWYAWRRNVLSETEINQLIDELEAEISEAYARPGNESLDESSRWAVSSYGSRFGFGNLSGEMDHLKDWLGTRLGAFDDAFGKPPVLNQFGGTAPMGFDLTISLPAGAAGTIYYTLDGTDPRVEGGSVSASALVYTGPVELNGSTRVFTRIQYSSGNEAGFPYQHTVDWSAKSATLFNVDPPATSNNLAITEIHYHPYRPSAAEAASGYSDADAYEFIELMNRSGAPIDLSGVAFTNGISFSFDDSPIILLNPGERVVLTPEDDAFTARYPGIPFAGRYTGQLDNNGETLSLAGRDGQAIQEISFADGGIADGLGHSLRVHPGAEGSSLASDWLPSCAFHGTPGSAGTSDCRDVVINEVLAHTDAPLSDRIELHNPGALPVDIGFWLLSDSTDYLKFQVPGGTILPPGGYLNFDESDFNPNGEWNTSPAGPVDTNRHFAFSASTGDEVYLVVADVNSNVTRVADAYSFRATLNGESLGRFDNGDGNFYPMRERSPGMENGHVRTGPLVITEIMYNPSASTNDFDLEYIELGNIGSQVEDLADWALEGAVDYTFPASTLLNPGASLVIVGFDPNNAAVLSVFQNAYGLITPLGPWSGHLNNAGETLWLLRADDPPIDQPLLTPLVEEERVSYGATAPWDSAADGTGMALGRLVQSHFADTNANWSAQQASLGLMPIQVWIDTYFTPLEQANPAMAGLSADADADGLSNEEEYLLGTHPRDAGSGLVLASGNGPHTLRWPSVPGRCYHIDFHPALDAAPWQRLPNLRFLGTGGLLEWTDTDSARVQAAPRGYYRVVVE
jgi:hypothetical protein